MTDYLATAPEDSRATFAQLTRKFQRESGGYGGYRGFWGTIETATPSNVEADGEAMTVSYDVSYRMKDGSRSERLLHPRPGAGRRQLPDRRRESRGADAVDPYPQGGPGSATAAPSLAA